MSSWACLEPGCGAGGTGPADDVDRAAARHTTNPPKHPTSTSTRDVHPATKEPR